MRTNCGRIAIDHLQRPRQKEKTEFLNWQAQLRIGIPEPCGQPSEHSISMHLEPREEQQAPTKRGCKCVHHPEPFGAFGRLLVMRLTVSLFFDHSRLTARPVVGACHSADQELSIQKQGLSMSVMHKPYPRRRWLFLLNQNNPQFLSPFDHHRL